jgi:transposase
MSKKSRRRPDAGLKAKVELEALRNEATIAELAAQYQSEPDLRLEEATDRRPGCGFRQRGRQGGEASPEAEVSGLYAKIGQLMVERDFLS